MIIYQRKLLSEDNGVYRFWVAGYEGYNKLEFGLDTYKNTTSKYPSKERELLFTSDWENVYLPNKNHLEVGVDSFDFNKEKIYYYRVYWDSNTIFPDIRLMLASSLEELKHCEHVFDKKCESNSFWNWVGPWIRLCVDDCPKIVEFNKKHENLQKKRFEEAKALANASRIVEIGGFRYIREDIVKTHEEALRTKTVSSAQRNYEIVHDIR